MPQRPGAHLRTPKAAIRCSALLDGIDTAMYVSMQHFGDGESIGVIT